MMKVVLLAGGYGTRLSEETGIIPKPMIEVGGKPLLWHLMKYFSSFGLNHFIIALGYKGEVIKDYFLKYPKLHSDLKIDLKKGLVESVSHYNENWTVELIDTGSDVMTGGRLRRLRKYVDDTFIFTYGDGLSNVNLNRLVQFHKSHGKAATVTAVSPKQRFGLLKIREDSSVASFSEKPENVSDLINGGFFVLEPEVLDLIDGDHISWEKEPCETLVHNGEMKAFHHDGFWQCVDTLHELRLLREVWAEGRAEWKVWNE